MLNRFWEINDTIGERAAGLLAHLLAMVIVVRYLDHAGLGIFAFLAALLQLCAFLADAGMCDRFRNQYALDADPRERLRRTRRALLLTGLGMALLLIFSAAFDSAHTRIEERTVAYFLIALVIPLRNFNRLRLTLLHVEGKHRVASRLVVKRHLVFLAAVWGMAVVAVPPSLLVGAFLVAEVVLKLSMRKHVALPPLWQRPFFRASGETIRDGLRVLFSGEALDLVFQMDLLILGLYLPAYRLGAYAEAVLLARFFLLIPVGLKPVLHRQLAKLAGAGKSYAFSRTVHQARAWVFTLHAWLALLLTVYFEDVLHLLLDIYGQEAAAYQVLVIMLPGLVYFAAASISETALEASGHDPLLHRITGAVVCMNLALNLYLVPFAGLTGAAMATVIALLGYFLTVCAWRITDFSRIRLDLFLMAGGVTYLMNKLMLVMEIPFWMFLPLAPLALTVLFYGLSFYDYNGYDGRKGQTAATDG